ncbi:MAG: hypothetical protein ACT6FF_03780 [Methanosarcinaceae archaeon]
MVNALFYDVIDMVLRLFIVVLFILISKLLMVMDADVIRSRLFLQFEKIKRFFILLTIGGICFLAASLIRIAQILDMVQANPGMLDNILIILFQIFALLFLYCIYDTLKFPERGVL